MRSLRILSNSLCAFLNVDSTFCALVCPIYLLALTGLIPRAAATRLSSAFILGNVLRGIAGEILFGLNRFFIHFIISSSFFAFVCALLYSTA